MAANYTIVGSRNTDELLGGATLRPVVSVGVTTKPSGIYFEFRQPHEPQIQASIAARASIYADEIEAIVQSPEVVAASYVQDVTPGGQLRDLLEIFVTDPTGAAQDSFEQPFSNLDAAEVGPKIVAMADSLTALLAL